MTEPYNYKKLIKSFVSDEISTEKFIDIYIQKFLNEKGDLSDELFERLDWLFAEVDGCTNNETLLSLQPDFHFTEAQLKKTAKEILYDIEKIEKLK